MWKTDPNSMWLPHTGDQLFPMRIAEIADGLCDLIYVVIYTANRYGIDLSPVWDEVQRSNMSKVGGVINEHGKLIKPDTYSPANLRVIVEQQLGYGN